MTTRLTAKEKDVLGRIANSGGVLSTTDPAVERDSILLRKMEEEHLVVLKRQRETGRAPRAEWHLTVEGRAALDGSHEVEPAVQEHAPTQTDLQATTAVILSEDEFWEFWGKWAARP